MRFVSDLQVFAFELVTFAVDFVPLAVGLCSRIRQFCSPIHRACTSIRRLGNRIRLRLKRIVIFDIWIFGRFLNEYPNILLRPYCLKMMDKVTYIKSVLITSVTALFHCIELNLKYAQQKLKINNKMGSYCNKVCDICIHQKCTKL